MFVHLVLFRLRAGLSDADRDVMLDSFQRACREIPSVMRATIGLRTLVGAGYEQANGDAFPYAAMLEFNDPAGLKDYLQHAAHAEPARLFFAAIEASLIADYQMTDLGARA